MNIFNSETYLKELEKLSSKIEITEGCVLVTGATGLVGSCLIDILIYLNANKNCNFEIYALGRSLEKLNKRFAVESKSLHFIVQDICAPIKIDIEFDYIFHTASNADPSLYTINPVETILINIIGTNNVLDYCLTHKKTKVIYTSTFEVNGLIEGKSIYKETDIGNIDLSQLRSCYASSKRTAESLILSYISEYNLDINICRLPSVYGPTMTNSDSKAHSQFLFNAVNKTNIILKSAGTQKRVYCYVIDIVKALFFIALNGIKGEIYNISNMLSIISIKELAELIAKLGGVNVEYKNMTCLEQKIYSKPHDIILDNEKIEALGCSFDYDIKTGIYNTLEILSEIK